MTISEPDLVAASGAIEVAASVVDAGTRTLTANGGPDSNQVLAYDLAHAAAQVTAARAMQEYGSRGKVEACIACAFTAEMIHDLITRIAGRESMWGVEIAPLTAAHPILEKFRAPEFVASLAETPGALHLDTEMTMVADTFRNFADKVIKPHAEHVHRTNADVPEDIVQGLAAMGAFGLSVPAEYGGFSEGGSNEYIAMVVATEELSRGSLGIGGSLITRPEILTRALLKGGTEEQKAEWLPKLATAEVMPAVAVTEPDYGSDVASLKVTATADTGPDGEPGYAINGVKTWCTFGARADVLALLARTDTDAGKTHRGLSLFIVPKPRGEGHAFAFSQPARNGVTGTIEGRAIDTIGYRGMHSYEVSLVDWWVPAANLIGEADGLGKGFAMQMAGFENGRLQTAARAVGVMQAAYEAALDYARNRKVFGAPIADYQLTRVKLGRMVMLIQAGRQFAYRVARLMAESTDERSGTTEAAMVKAYVCKAAEWVTREAMQIHGGMGYAEEFPVSRFFVDARVLSIFEGADETLCLKVIARRLCTETA